MEPYWSETNGHAPHPVKYESEAAVPGFQYCTDTTLNFSTNTTNYSEDDAECPTGRRNKTSRQDPLSHRIIEKRRRDRMNSCLADLSRLIPPQYQRKGRGRIEKTEIIEMAIRHLKHLQSECVQKENEYRLGYRDCMKETAKFLCDSHMEDFCYRLLARLHDHCEELLKGDCYKSRVSHVPDNVSASSGSPHQNFHIAPTSQLREMLGTSDIEHSNDHNDVKDLSFRNHLNQIQRNNNNNPMNGHVDNHMLSSNNNIGYLNNNTNSTSSIVNKSSNSSPINSILCKPQSQQHPQQQPNQAPVITSTAPASLHHHTDSSNHDFESSRELMSHTDTSNMHSPPPRDSLLPPHAHLHHLNHTSDSQMSDRIRNFSESSHDIEHNNNYKYKNHIKERFNHELHDEETSSENTSIPLQSEHSQTHALSEHSKDGTEPEIAPIIAKKRKLAEAAAAAAVASLNANNHDSDANHHTAITTTTSSPPNISMRRIDDKPFAFVTDIKSEHSPTESKSFLQNKMVHLNSPSSTTASLNSAFQARPFAVPIFALHSQGTYYVPLNVDYNALIPFLNGVDLVEKNYATMPVVHPININVNFMPANSSSSILAAAAAAAAVAAGKQQAPPSINGVGIGVGVGINGAIGAPLNCKTSNPCSAILSKPITNGWQ